MINFIKLILTLITIHVKIMSMVSQIDSMVIESKSNGIVMIMKLDTLQQTNQINAWQAKTGWFYLTVFNTKGDSADIKPDIIPKEIKVLQIIDIKESTQIGIKINEPIEDYNFIYNDYDQSITANLFYSIEYFVKQETKNQKVKEINKNDRIPYRNNWLYRFSIFMMILGVANESGSLENSYTKAGASLFFSAFIFSILSS